MSYRFCFLIFCFLNLLIPLRNIILKIDRLFFNFPILNTTNLLFGVLIICALLQERRYNIYKSKLTLPIILYCVYFLFQIFNTDNPYKLDLLIFWKDRFLFPLILFFITVSILKSKREVLILLAVMVFANFYMDTYFWRWIRWMNLATFQDKIKSVNGTFADIGGCNEWAAFFSTYLFIYLAMLNAIKKKWLNYLIKGMLIANFFVLLFSFSRGSYLAFLIGSIWYSIKTKKYKIIVALLLVIIFYNVILPEPVIERIEMTFRSGEETELADQDVNSRLMMWQYAMENVKRSPIWGYGLLSFKYEHWNNPHNQYLNTLYQGGIVGLILFVWILVAAFKDANYLYKISNNTFDRMLGLGMCCAVLSLAVANVFGDRWTYLPIVGYFFIICGIIVFILNKYNLEDR